VGKISELRKIWVEWNGGFDAAVEWNRLIRVWRSYDATNEAFDG
jgi:hypothetical protein